MLTLRIQHAILLWILNLYNPKPLSCYHAQRGDMTRVLPYRIVSMTDIQFDQLIATIENFKLMVFIGINFVLLGIGWQIGGQR